MMASSDLKQTKRLLCVEDHYLFRTAFALLLEWHMDLGSVQAKSLAEARRALSNLEEEFNLAIVDFDLPMEKVHS